MSEKVTENNLRVDTDNQEKLDHGEDLDTGTITEDIKELTKTCLSCLTPTCLDDQDEEEVPHFSDIDLTDLDLNIDSMFLVSGLAKNSLKTAKEKLISKISKIKNGKEKFLGSLKAKTGKLENKLKEAPFIRFRDKFAFVVGIVFIVLSYYILGKNPVDGFYIWHTIQTVFLVTVRLYLYKKQKYHYYLFDFCYYGNFCLLVYLFVYPKSLYLFKICFAFCNGPIIVGIPLFRNSLVLHSLDKITSFFIHVSPNLMVWSLRWYSTTSKNFVSDFENPEFNMKFLISYIGNAYLIYMIWAISYYLKFFIISKDKIKIREYETAFNYLTRNINSFAFKMCNIFGKNHLELFFMLNHIVISFIAMIFSFISYNSFYFHTTYMICLVLLGTWNGACFYMEHFAKTYEKKLNEIEQIKKSLNSN